LERAWNARLTKLPTSTCTKADVLHELAGDYDYIHLMDHGEFDLLDPMNSAIHLVRDPKRDSQRVTARDLLSVRFKRSPVITLSGCSTGLSWGLGANDYSGLRGSLLRAGARGIVASRWEVYDDAARAFMVSLHERLAREDGSGIASHVSATQAEMRARVPIEDWAAFGYLGVP
jgi:CHAT domain-containing protein